MSKRGLYEKFEEEKKEKRNKRFSVDVYLEHRLDCRQYEGDVCRARL